MLGRLARRFHFWVLLYRKYYRRCTMVRNLKMNLRISFSTLLGASHNISVFVTFLNMLALDSQFCATITTTASQFFFEESYTQWVSRCCTHNTNRNKYGAKDEAGTKNGGWRRANCCKCTILIGTLNSTSAAEKKLNQKCTWTHSYTRHLPQILMSSNGSGSYIGIGTATAVAAATHIMIIYLLNTWTNKVF